MKPKALVISSYNPLSEELVKTLLSSGCEVYTLTKDTKNWQKLNFANRISFVSQKHKLTERINYIFILQGFGGRSFGFDFCFLKDLIARKVLIFPLRVENKKDYQSICILKKEFSQNRLYKKEIFAGEVIDFSNGNVNFFIPKAAYEAFRKKKIYFSKDEKFLYIAKLQDVIRAALKLAFSFDNKDETVVVAQKIPLTVFFQKLKIFIPELKAVFEGRKGYFFSFKNIRVADKDHLKALDSFIKYTHYRYLTTRQKVKRVKIEIPKINLQKRFKFFLIGVFVFLVFPSALYFFSLFTLATAYFNASSGKLSFARSLTFFGNLTSSFSYKIFDFYSYTPLIGKIFVPLRNNTYLLDKTYLVSLKAFEVFEYYKNIFEVILSEKDYDLELLAGKAAISLKDIYTQTSFLQTQLDELPFLKKFVDFNSSALSEGRLLIYQLARLSERLPELLGKNGKRTYLLLFQNNSELRATGGFIGSFALITLDKGKLIDTSIYDVYTADGQLKGHVEPPLPIKSYLGEANWYLRDSNWDADFPTSAKRAEWFLEKEFERSVDGVIGVDLEIVKDLLEITGPIKLEDFQITLNHKNFYEKIQYEVEGDFFPGSRQKADILTALVNSLLANLLEIKDEARFIKIARIFYKNLQSKSVQLYFHDSNAAKALREIGWDGSIKIPSCKGNCTAVFLGVVESNLGVNKANYFIRRSMNLSSYVFNEKIDNYLSIVLKNDSPETNLLFGRYKVYIRLLTNPQSIFKKVEVIGKDKILLDPEIKDRNSWWEAGVLVEVPAKEERTILFSWTQKHSVDFSTKGEISYYWRKQAGTKEDPIYLQIYAPFAKKEGIKYNTLLSKDFYINLSW